jgi:hypothetical protein
VISSEARVSAEPEECGMAERHDAGKAENEIEREREQNHDQRLAAQNHLVREDKKGGDAMIHGSASAAR